MICRYDKGIVNFGTDYCNLILGLSFQLISLLSLSDIKSPNNPKQFINNSNQCISVRLMLNIILKQDYK